jgi:hypothetical protein
MSLIHNRVASPSKPLSKINCPKSKKMLDKKMLNKNLKFSNAKTQGIPEAAWYSHQRPGGLII